MSFAKTPLNYTGHKFSVLPLLAEKLPVNKDTVLVDLFCGSGTVGVNLAREKLILSDANAQLMDLLQWWYETPLETVLATLDTIIDEWSLDRKNESGYLAFRARYNQIPTPAGLQVLIAHSNSNYMRFNSSGEFNVPFGKRTFNARMRANTIAFVTKLKSKEVMFLTQDYQSTCLSFESGRLLFNLNTYKDKVLFYLDPPYNAGNANYNVGWSSYNDFELLQQLDRLNTNDFKWAMSNAIENNGYKNQLLSDWLANRPYNVYSTDEDYNGSSAVRKNKGKTKGVLVTNYQ